MFVIKDITSNYYFHKGNKIIIFEDFNTAQEMLNNFFNYSMNRMVQENPFRISEVVMYCQNLQVIEVDFDMNIVETINFNEI